MIQKKEKNLAEIILNLEAEGFIKGTNVFEKIVQGRLKGYTKDTCPHPEYVLNGAYLLCSQCGDQTLT